MIAMAGVACPETKDTFRSYLDSLERNPATGPWLRHKVELATYQHLSKFALPEVMKDYLLSHQGNDTLYEIAYLEAMHEESYGLAVRLSRQALSRQTDAWEKPRYERHLLHALLADGRVDEAKPIAKRHAETGDTDACKTYLDLLSGDERTTEAGHLLDVFMAPGMHVDAFKTVATMTGQTERMIEFAEKYTVTITEFSDVTSKAFPERTLKVYERLIMDFASHASDRRAYRHIAFLLRRARKELGDVALGIKDTLLGLYPRKRALRDELEGKRR
jgi:hypothetical protein